MIVVDYESVRDTHHRGFLNVHGTHVTANYSTNKNGVFFFISDLKIVYYNNN